MEMDWDGGSGGPMLPLRLPFLRGESPRSARESPATAGRLRAPRRFPRSISDLRPLFSVLCPLFSVLCPLSSVLRPLSSDLRPLTSVLCPLFSVHSAFSLLKFLPISFSSHLLIMGIISDPGSPRGRYLPLGSDGPALPGTRRAMPG